MKKLFNILFLIVVIYTIYSCKSVDYKYIEVPKETVKIEYKQKVVHDSIYNLDSIYIKDKGDTIYYYQIKYKYKYKYLTDTIYHADTIKVSTIKPVEVTKEIVTNKIKWYQKFLMYVGGVFMLFFIYKLTKYFKK